MGQKGWMIEFAEKPLQLGIIDNLVYQGRDASHSFLRLLTPEGKIVAELHGLSYDTVDKKLLDFSFNPIKWLRHKAGELQYKIGEAQRTRNLGALFNGVSGSTYEPDQLKVINYKGEATRDPNIVASPIFQGNERDVLEKWVAAQKMGEEISKRGYVYKPFAIPAISRSQNCHTVTRALAEAMGLTLPAGQYATPGIQNHFNGISASFLRSTLRFGGQTLEFLRERSRELAETLNPETLIPDGIKSANDGWDLKAA